MKTAKVFRSGNSQAVRIPKDFHLEGKEVEIIQKSPHEIILREIPKNLAEAFNILAKFSDDFFADGRHDPLPQKRELF
ncbi:MAG: type II toxin-antitoxin system VapB family antitoxin [Chlamydiales bacterium]|nr:type II toxin-antitoxin system VapB family antitoxin [Chlamydiales bacterium]